MAVPDIGLTSGRLEDRSWKRQSRISRRGAGMAKVLIAIALLAAAIVGGVLNRDRLLPRAPRPDRKKLAYQPRKPIDTGGFNVVLPMLKAWPRDASLAAIAGVFRGVAYRDIEELEKMLASPDLPDHRRIVVTLMKAGLFLYEGEPERAERVLEEARSWLEAHDAMAEQWLYTVIYFQGVTALRLRRERQLHRLCRGESSCILPIAPAAVHTKPAGSRLAIQHFTEYLEQFPDDLEVRWLLNLAHMTLGEYPGQGRSPLPDRRSTRFLQSEFDIGKFRDVGHQVGVNRFNQAGGAIMDDFDGDGLLDLAVTVDGPDPADGLLPQPGRRDIRGPERGGRRDRTSWAAWSATRPTTTTTAGWTSSSRAAPGCPHPIRPSPAPKQRRRQLHRRHRAKPGCSSRSTPTRAAWADYDNDGWLDLFVACEQQPNRLYHNRGDGTFEEVAAQGRRAAANGRRFYKGCTWIDYDNDGYPDLFLNSLSGTARLFHNNRDGTLHRRDDRAWASTGRTRGFSCWAWDYDNDGWLDIFATVYDRTLDDVVKGLLGQPH